MAATATKLRLVLPTDEEWSFWGIEAAGDAGDGFGLWSARCPRRHCGYQDAGHITLRLAIRAITRHYLEAHL